MSNIPLSFPLTPFTAEPEASHSPAGSAKRSELPTPAIAFADIFGRLASVALPASTNIEAKPDLEADDQDADLPLSPADPGQTEDDTSFAFEAPEMIDVDHEFASLDLSDDPIDPMISAAPISASPSAPVVTSSVLSQMALGFPTFAAIPTTDTVTRSKDDAPLGLTLSQTSRPSVKSITAPTAPLGLLETRVPETLNIRDAATSSTGKLNQYNEGPPPLVYAKDAQLQSVPMPTELSTSVPFANNSIASNAFTNPPQSASQPPLPASETPASPTPPRSTGFAPLQPGFFSTTPPTSQLSTLHRPADQPTVGTTNIPATRAETMVQDLTVSRIRTTPQIVPENRDSSVASLPSPRKIDPPVIPTASTGTPPNSPAGTVQSIVTGIRHAPLNTPSTLDTVVPPPNTPPTIGAVPPSPNTPRNAPLQDAPKTDQAEVPRPAQIVESTPRSQLQFAHQLASASYSSESVARVEPSSALPLSSYSQHRADRSIPASQPRLTPKPTAQFSTNAASLPPQEPPLPAEQTKIFPQAATDPLLRTDFAPESMLDLRHGATATMGQPRIANSGFHPGQTANQMIEALQSTRGGPVEFHLAPEELGRLRISLTPSDGAISMNILADRGETLDLLRRNISLLADEFRNMGYDDIQFSFGQSNNGGAANSGQPFEETTPSSETLDTAGNNQSANATPSHNIAAAPTDGLDLRL